MSLDLTGIVSLDDTPPNAEQEISDDSQEIKLQKLQAEIDALKASTENTRNNTQLKKELAFKIFEFMIQFTTFIGVILGAYVAQHIFQNKSIPDNVLITLITTTFATVIGLMVIILKGLFGSKGS
ncbi:hypothetical protein [Pseudoalteromonas sp. T1lg122]|uniref:hypothetical protein n=1 Tax=Pseudoalteromonas sp. T1lg122 TaxID=2077094 RepID=UPI000CF6BB8F|nr:hypothetical protein [Pseudoalteromonas sp. T1lg122]